jgi:aminopeptidase C
MTHAMMIAGIVLDEHGYTKEWRIVMHWEATTYLR